MTGKRHSANTASATPTQNRRSRSKRIDPETRFFKIVSLGTIITGVLACLASVGVGMGLVLAGTMILAEV